MGHSTSSGKDKITRQSAYEDYFEYEKARAMKEYSETGIFPTQDLYGDNIPAREAERLRAEAEFIMANMENTGFKTLYRGLVMDEADISALKVGSDFSTKALTSSSPDKKLAAVYANTDNYFGEASKPTSVIVTIQNKNGVRGFTSPNRLEVILPKGQKYKVARKRMENGVAYIDLYSSKKEK